MAEQEDADAGGMWLYKAGVPRFSLVLWSKPFREGKLRLPKGFAKEHGAQLANEVLLKLPNGAEWQVSVVRGRKRIWFVKGWSEFAEFYSLKPTNYLVFGLASTNRLNVIVFDTTATEIDYSNKKVNIKVESECDIESNEALERPSPSSPRARGKSSLKPLKLRRRNITERTASGTINERATGILAKANVVFESENPFFMSVIQKTHLIPGRRLNVPTIFFKTYFLEERGNILLQLPNVGLWNVEYLFIDYSYQKRAFFEAKSWGSFARANSLKVGDVCAFELVEGGTEPRFDVTIFQTSQVMGSSSSRLFQNGRTSVPATQSGFTCRPNKHVHSPKTRDKPSLRSPQPHKLRRTDGMDETASSSKAENPFFIVVMHPSYIGPGKRLYAPAKFFEKNFTDQCGAIVLQLPGVGRLWNVEYLFIDYSYQKKAFFEAKSWGSFAQASSLKVGDVCAFELVEGGTEPRFDVTIFQTSQVTDSSSSRLFQNGRTSVPATQSGFTCRPNKHVHSPKHLKVGDQRKKPLRPAMEAANAFTSNQPFFKTAVTPANLKRRQVAIPVPFWNHMKKGTRKMELRVGSQVWEVSVSKYEADLEKKRTKRVYINGGWGKFAEGNSLVAGDVCVFELIKGEQEEDADTDVDAAGLGMTVACVHVFKG
ncbi:B3 domain-containing transcription factor VRN1 [Linum perenne]